MQFGSGAHTYELVAGWGQLPRGWQFGQVAGVAVDAQDRVHVLHRGEHPVIVFDRDGSLLDSWGDGLFRDPHAIYISEDGHQYIVDRGGHVVHRFTPARELELTLGTKDVPSEKQSGLPFNLVAGVSLSASGDIYVADGYGNSRVHKYSPQGSLLFSWGTPGEGPGQFNLPHAVWEDRQRRVLVCDRENGRIQIFSPEGDYLGEWGGFKQPTHVYAAEDNTLYVSELAGRVSILASDGSLLARWGEERTHDPGLFFAPHGIWADSRGDVYVAEVLEGKRLQKFARRPQ